MSYSGVPLSGPEHLSGDALAAARALCVTQLRHGAALADLRARYGPDVARRAEAVLAMGDVSLANVEWLAAEVWSKEE